jgi:hypothetical protein
MKLSDLILVAGPGGSAFDLVAVSPSRRASAPNGVSQMGLSGISGSAEPLLAADHTVGTRKPQLLRRGPA